MVKRIAALVTGFFFLTAAVFAQEEELIEFEFKVFGFGKDSYEGLYYFSRGEYLPLSFHKTHRSITEYRYQGPPTMEIFAENSGYNAQDPASKPYLPVASAEIGRNADEMLMLFSAAPDNRQVANEQRQFRIFPLNDKKSYFKRNTIVVLNATGARLLGKVSETRIALPVGLSEPISYDGGRSRAQGTLIAFALETQQGVKLVMSNDIRLSENRRILLILEPPRRPGSFRIAARMLSESVFEPGTPEEE